MRVACSVLLSIRGALQRTCVATKVHFGFIYTPLQVTQLRRSNWSWNRMKMARGMCEWRCVLTRLFMGVRALQTCMFPSVCAQMYVGMPADLSRVSEMLK